ncbi:kunitz/Bovine pancreatic trypsin inhibitor domain-containing protein [Phthorimaea operculella]|nr:kunitz/Bovine pancreatic trypsin inhibitor domain-containing protein [Phthorimaea operculella]
MENAIRPANICLPIKHCFVHKRVVIALTTPESNLGVAYSVQSWVLELENEVKTSTETLTSTWPIPTSSLQPFDPWKNVTFTTNATTEGTEKQEIEDSTTISPRTDTDDATIEDTINIPYENITDLVSYIRGPAHRRSGGGGEKKFEWSWDRWCQLQPRAGDCKQVRTYYYYQAQSDTCREFTYTGCNGNENRFNTVTDCERFCKGYGTEMDIKSLREVEACSLQPDPGNCLALIHRYYYDVNNGGCREFVFGGCGGNANRFVSKDDCEQKCGGILQRHAKRARGERFFIVPYHNK